jgi:L-iditol 2-dehydrogenase
MSEGAREAGAWGQEPARVRSVELIRPGSVTLGERAVPEMGPGDARVAVLAVGICGSDLHVFHDGALGAAEAACPFVMGHEAVGLVEAAHDDADRWLVGRRVSIEPTISCGRCAMCHSGSPNLCLDQRFVSLPPHLGLLRERVTHPARLLEPVPDVLSDAAATTLEPLAVGLNALDLLHARTGESIAVLGCGGLGLTAIVLARHAGLCPIVATDPLPDRRMAALEVGATEAVPPDEAERACARTGATIGVDHVIEASGSAEAQAQAAVLARPGGRLAIVGTHTGGHLAFPGHLCRRKGLTILMVRRSRHTLGRCCAIAGRPDVAASLERIVTHRFPIAEAQRAFDTASSRGDGCCRVSIVIRGAGLPPFAAQGPAVRREP